MKSNLVIDFENLLTDKLIAYMQIQDFKEDNLDLKIQVYFPKIVSNICTFLNKEFGLKDKEKVVIKRDKDGYHFVDVYFNYKNKQIGLRIQSMLKDTWGVANNN